MNPNVVLNSLELVIDTLFAGKIIIILVTFFLLMLLLKLVIKFTKPLVVIALFITCGIFLRLNAPNTFEAGWETFSGIFQLAMDFGNEAILLTEAHLQSLK